MLKFSLRNHHLITVSLGILFFAVFVGVIGQTVLASAPLPPDPQSGSVGVQGRLGAPPPTQGATITTPNNGQTFTTNPITVNGICPKGLVVKVFSNNVFVGSVVCNSGSYSLQIDLFSGRNDIIVRVYDALDQAGPDSNTVTVNYNNAQFAQFGAQLLLTSGYAKRGANPGQQLDWPIILSGGTGPYAFSIDWGDGTPPELLSAAFPGTITISHTYTSAGVYTVIVRVTDKNNQLAFLQLIGVANGPVSQNTTSGNAQNGGSNTITKPQVVWWPAVPTVPLIVAAFWLGRRHELFSLRRQLENNSDNQS